jgi:hypothetical protein
MAGGRSIAAGLGLGLFVGDVGKIGAGTEEFHIETVWIVAGTEMIVAGIEMIVVDVGKIAVDVG